MEENIATSQILYWKRLVLRAAEHACRQGRNLQLVHALHRRFIDVLKQENLITVEGNVQKDHIQTGESQTEIHACIACGRCFRTRGGLGAHNFKKHKIVSHARPLFDQTSCGACLREYRRNGKLKTHLLVSNGCRGILLQRRHYVHPVPGAGSRVDQMRARKHDGILLFKVKALISLQFFLVVTWTMTLTHRGDLPWFG